MRLNTNIFRIRTSLTLAPLATLFFLYCSFILILPDFLTTREGLSSDNGIIEAVFPNIEIQKNIKRDSHVECLDIVLKNKNYIIRLTNRSEKDEWLVINNRTNLNKTIEFKYLSHVLHDNILYNPSELTIDNKTIIKFSDSKKSWFWLFFATGIAGIVFGFFSFLAIKTYINEYLPTDRTTYMKGFWKLAKVWFNDWTNT